MPRLKRIKTVTRVQKKNAFGIDYYPRVEISGQELEQAGFLYGSRYEVIIDTEAKQIILTSIDDANNALSQEQ
jgi:hypothetical protein